MRRLNFAAAAAPLILVLAACGTAATPIPSLAPASVTPSTAPASATPSTAPASTTPSSAPSAATSGATVDARPVGSIGTVLVAGSTGMTVYTFTKDTKDSGKSECTGGCLDTWPALTVKAGETPTAGTGVTGTLATITRDDGGGIQVTYNGLPLYFFKNDRAPGDANGVYTNWEAVKP